MITSKVVEAKPLVPIGTLTNISSRPRSLRAEPRTLFIHTVGPRIGDVEIEETSKSLTAITVIAPDLCEKYFYWYLKMIKEEWKHKSSGSALPRISNSMIANTLIPLPSLSKQKAIARRLNQGIGRLEALAEENQNTLQLARKHIQAKIELFFEPITQPTIILANLIKRLSSDNSLSPLGQVNLRKLNSDRITSQTSRTSARPTGRIFALEKGDLIIKHEDYSQDNLWQTILVEDDLCLQIRHGFQPFRVKNQRVLPKYLHYYTRTHQFRTSIKGMILRSIVSRIPYRQALTAAIPVPSIETQERIVKELEQTQQHFYNLDHEIQKSIELNRLLQHQLMQTVIFDTTSEGLSHASSNT